MKYQLEWIGKQLWTAITTSLEITGFLVEDIATAVIFTEPEEQESPFLRSCK